MGAPHFSHFFVSLAAIPAWGVRGRFSLVFAQLSDQEDHCCYGFFFHLNGFPKNHPVLPECILIHTLIHCSTSREPFGVSEATDPRICIVSYPLSRLCAFSSPLLVAYLSTSKCDRPARNPGKSTIRHRLQSLSDNPDHT